MTSDGSVRIDAHHHVWDLAVRDQPCTDGVAWLRRSFGLDHLAPSLAAHEIDGTIVVQTRNDVAETRELLVLAEESSGLVRGVVGWVDLMGDVSAQVDQTLDQVGGELLVGVRHQLQEMDGEPDWLGRTVVRDGLRVLGSAGLVYDLAVSRHQLPSVIDVVGALPEVQFVLDHAGKPGIASRELQPWAAQVAALAAQPNIAVKLSGLVTQASSTGWSVEDLRPFVDVLLEEFGPGRTMYGSDWPVCLLAAGYDDVVATAELLTSALSELERGAVFGGTAARWYGLAP